MSIYVDPIREVEYGRWRYACHMIADTVDELHAIISTTKSSALPILGTREDSMNAPPCFTTTLKGHR